MGKLKCDNSECDHYNQELDIVEWKIITTAEYDETTDDYKPRKFSLVEYTLACPYCGIPLSEP